MGLISRQQLSYAGTPRSREDRAVAAFASFFLVDRSLTDIGDREVRLTVFGSIFRALPPEAKKLRDLLLSKPEDLKVGGTSFFDDDRLAYLRGLKTKKGDESPPPPGHRCRFNNMQELTYICSLYSSTVSPSYNNCAHTSLGARLLQFFCFHDHTAGKKKAPRDVISPASAPSAGSKAT